MAVIFHLHHQEGKCHHRGLLNQGFLMVNLCLGVWLNQDHQCLVKVFHLKGFLMQGFNDLVCHSLVCLAKICLIKVLTKLTLPLTLQTIKWIQMLLDQWCLMVNQFNLVCLVNRVLLHNLVCLVNRVLLHNLVCQIQICNLDNNLMEICLATINKAHKDLKVHKVQKILKLKRKRKEKLWL